MIGFDYHAKWADAVSLQALIGSLSWEQPSIRMFGKQIKIPRLTCWMGDASYTYSGHRNEPVAMPEIVSNMKIWIETYTGARFNSVLANYYRDGSDSVSWHSDDEPELGEEPVIASLSFGATRSFFIKSKATGDKTTLNLQHGDLLVMSGASQRDYLHSVPKTAKPVGARINLTFRSVK